MEPKQFEIGAIPPEAFKSFNQAAAALNTFGLAVGTALMPQLRVVADHLRQIEILLWEEYRQAGSPYGHSEEAMWLWHQHRLLVYCLLREP